MSGVIHLCFSSQKPILWLHHHGKFRIHYPKVGGSPEGGEDEQRTASKSAEDGRNTLSVKKRADETCTKNQIVGYAGFLTSSGRLFQ